MWVILGNKTRVKPVPGGQVLETHCEECGTLRSFVECNVADELTVFFLPVFDLKSRRLVYTECGDARERPPSRPAAPLAAPGAPPRPPQATEAEFDRMLAELKRKMAGGEQDAFVSAAVGGRLRSFWRRLGSRRPVFGGPGDGRES